jgi:O-acetylhomoserine (thiol)-lyase
MKGFTSAILHFTDKKSDVHGSLRPPIYECGAFEFGDAECIAGAFDGSKPAHSYSRVSNPTVEALEQRVTAMAGARGTVAVASGMAAITTLVIALCESGSTIVASSYLFGNTISLFEKTLGPWGLKVKWVDPGDLHGIERAIDKTTRLVFMETVSNPQIMLCDVAAIGELCERKRIPFVLDNSPVTSYLLRSKDFGVSVEITSSTKYLSGGGTSIGGLIIDNGLFDWRKSPRIKDGVKKWGEDALIRTLRSSVGRNMGACMAPHAAYLQTLGLETLGLRIDRSSDNALAVARFLESHPLVRKVFYPGLEKSPYHALCKKQFRHGRCGGLLSFELDAKASPARFIDSLKLFRRSTNFNDNKSLVIHPASTIFCEYSKRQLRQMGISEAMIRLSIGIEEAEDIITDLSNALETV